MNSASSGLVRRRTAAETSSSDYNNSTSNNDHNDNFKDDADEDNIEETSDKETRLTLMEEVLLLGLKDKEVSWKTIAALAFRNKYLQTMRFDEREKKVKFRRFLDARSERGRRKGDEDDGN
jgi:hypothetical protein